MLIVLPVLLALFDKRKFCSCPAGDTCNYGLRFFALGVAAGDCAAFAAAAGLAAAGAGDIAAGVALPAGTTPAPESGAGEETGEGWVVAGDGETPALVCCFINSRRSPLSPALLCAYKIDKANVIAKKMPASQAVNFTSTLVVCAPKIFSVTPPPKAAPKPSLFGRCIRITKTMSTATRT